MISIKNNNLYYNNYRVFNGEISIILVPLIILLIFKYKNLIKFASQIFIIVSIIGSINILIGYKLIKKYNLVFISFLGILIHLPGLYPLINYKKYFQPNIIQYILGIIAILVCMFLPYWPYLLSRENTIIIILLIYFFTYILYKILYK